MKAWLKTIFNIKKEIHRNFRDENIEWHGDKICLKRKNYPGMKDDFREYTTEEKNKMKIHLKAKKKGMWEVNGVIIYADSAIEAQNRYLGKHYDTNAS